MDPDESAADIGADILQEQKNIEALIGAEEAGVEISARELSIPARETALSQILQQRQDHRDLILNFCKTLASYSLYFLVILISCQGVVRVWYSDDFNIIDDTTLQIFTLGVFGQILGVVHIITKSLWDDKNYMRLFKKIDS